MKRLLIMFMAAGLIAVAAFAGTARAGGDSSTPAPVAPKSYCPAKNPTYTTNDSSLQAFLDRAIARSGGMYSISVAYDANGNAYATLVTPSGTFVYLIESPNVFDYTFNPGDQYNPLFTPIAGGACVVYVPPPPTVAVCKYMARADGSMGAFQGPILLSQWLDPKSPYHDATPANFVEGVGLTCDAPPAGYVQNGLAGNDQHVAGGMYPLWQPPKK